MHMGAWPLSITCNKYKNRVPPLKSSQGVPTNMVRVLRITDLSYAFNLTQSSFNNCCGFLVVTAFSYAFKHKNILSDVCKHSVKIKMFC